MKRDVRARRFEIAAGELCLDLANTRSGARGGAAADLLESYGDLVEWSEAAALVGAAAARRLRREGERRAVAAAAVLARGRALRETIYRLFVPAAAGRFPNPAEVDALNAELVRALPHARISRAADGFGWSWDDAESALEGILWPVVGSAARLLTSDRAAAIRECAAETCAGLFVDGTRNHSRRWCDMRTCGNQAKARRSRRRPTA